MICLVRLPAVECFRFATTTISPPLGLAYIAGALVDAGREVRVIDAVAEAPTRKTHYFKGYLVGLGLSDVADRIPAEASVVGLSVIFTHEWPEAVHLVELIKARRPDLTVVLGGEHVTAMPEFCLMTSEADIIVMGEGEETIVDLLEALDSGRPLAAVDGIGFREGRKVVVNRRRSRSRHVDEIPRPAWHLFAPDVYHEHRMAGSMYTDSLTIPILATRGCPYQCTFCSSPNMWLPQWYPRDPVRVVDEIDYYVREFGARNFPFHDLTAIIKKSWIIEFCEELLRRRLDITWQLPSGTRSEAIDAEVADLLYRTNMIAMAYAPESGSEYTRRLIRKRMTTDRLFASMRAAADAKLNVSVYLLLGFPHDTRTGVLENVEFLERLAADGLTDVSIGFYMAHPGTELFYSLYDAERIRIDRGYFLHLLQSLAVWPKKTYCESLTRVGLMRLKWRLYWEFYGAKRGSAERVPLLAAARRALSGLFGDAGHVTKLQTVARNALSSGLDTVRVRFGERWIPLDEELAMFEPWDGVYRAIRAQKLAGGSATQMPSDTSKLHEKNYAPVLKRENEARSLDFPAPSSR